MGTSTHSAGAARRGRADCTSAPLAPDWRSLDRTDTAPIAAVRSTMKRRSHIRGAPVAPRTECLAWCLSTTSDERREHRLPSSRGPHPDAGSILVRPPTTRTSVRPTALGDPEERTDRDACVEPCPSTPSRPRTWSAGWRSTSRSTQPNSARRRPSRSRRVGASYVWTRRRPAPSIRGSHRSPTWGAQHAILPAQAQ
jgi:hypothetical protein